MPFIEVVVGHGGDTVTGLPVAMSSYGHGVYSEAQMTPASTGTPSIRNCTLVWPTETPVSNPLELMLATALLPVCQIPPAGLVVTLPVFMVI